MASSPSLLHQHLLIRPARHDDAAAQHRLAARDSRRNPRGRVLVVANPFRRTANLVAMLRTRARALS